MARTKRILVGKFGAAHGVRGEIRLKSFTEDPQAIAGYKTLCLAGGEAVRIRSARRQGSMLIVGVDGVGTREAAEALKGAELFVDRAELPEPENEEYYHADLIGLEARAPDGGAIGTVAAVHDFGAGDILEIRPEGGASFMLAFTRQTVPKVDLEEGYLVIVRPPETEAREERP